MRPHNGLGCVSLRYPGWKVTTAGRILPLAATYLPTPALSGPSSRFWVATALPSRLSLPTYPLGLADTCPGHLPTRVVRRNPVF